LLLVVVLGLAVMVQKSQLLAEVVVVDQEQ
jgi:hypothetical protein